MKNKITSIITEITIDEHTFQNETFKPTLINYIYGGNGTGKTTISDYLKNPLSTYTTSVPRTQYELHIYNKYFITENIQSYGNIPSLFTITKKNAEVMADLENLNKQQKKAESDLRDKETEKGKVTSKRNTLSKKLLADVWKQTADMRELYKDALSRAGRQQTVLDQIKEAKPVPHDKEELQMMFVRSYGPDDVTYAPFEKAPESIRYDAELLAAPIVSSGSTPFAEFVKELQLSDWLMKGHSSYQHKAGDICPYCQQTLPDDFEKKLASCFDDSYQRQMDMISPGYDKFRANADQILSILENNIKGEFVSVHLHEYMALIEVFKEKANTCFDLWSKKYHEPAAIIELPDLSDTLASLNECIDTINREIAKHNDISTHRKAAQKECTQMIWEQMAFDCHEMIVEFKVQEEHLLEKENELETTVMKLQTSVGDYKTQIKEKSKETVNTTAVKDNINQLIHDAGFQGFELKEKRNAQYVYELVRKDGSVVNGLSEGERNFIGFLYFYHTVINSQSDDGIQHDKVVIIDDPVSSMDSSALFSVAALTRNLVAICYNNYDFTEGPDFIRQFICLTHNPFFYKEVSYNHVTDYECANYYRLRKDADNHSHVDICERDSTLPGGGKENYSPIKNTYDALWAEYKAADDSVILMNVIRRIMEYYFLQICGYNGNDLRKDMLDKHEPDFATPAEYNAASAMIAYLNVGAEGFDDGLYFDCYAVSVEQLRSACKTLFNIMHQEQHYDYMMK